MKKVYSLSLLAIMAISCNQFREATVGNQEGSYEGVAAAQVMGTVSVSTEGTFGTKNENKIERQLRREAKKLYPESTGIINVRIDGEQAYADVVR